ncbi:MAG: 3-hydroxyacyl-CoA dehydrogenase [Gammaproteobacteria bacterium SG8_11]|nr:MAG: 3-hydroxyacyl-CoA dehydrogenase [Gammaproteobacteria bacterium SG8_11]
MQFQKTHLPFQKAAVLGAGVMGSQIAAHLANAGLSVLLLDIPAKEGNKNAVVEGAFKRILKLKPNPFVTKNVVDRITLGNFDEHFDGIKEAEWIIEVVVENLEIKQRLMTRIENVADNSSVITTNTSGLPIRQIVEGCPDSFKKRFMGTHFFNPPRHLKLLEIIPTENTVEAILERIKWFGRVHLGKSVVIAKDTPNFIANRIGTYAIMQAIREFTEGEYTIEAIDTLTGELIGHPKSATFRTTDVVGLDTLAYVGENLYKAIPYDESREAHKPPEIMNQMVKNGLLGQKAKKGFYQKIGKEIFSLNPESMEYNRPKPMNLGDLKLYSKMADLKERIRLLYDDSGRVGEFTRRTMLDLIGYSARRIPEIADNPADVDRAICWGFGWELGPFQLWDTIGFDRILDDISEADIQIPEWVHEMKQSGAQAFYQKDNGRKKVYVPGSGYASEHEYEDEINLNTIKTERINTIIGRDEAALLDLGDGVALYEFRSKANSLGSDVVEGIFQAIDYVEQNDFHGLVIGNNGKNFSVGADLAEAAQFLVSGKMDELEKLARNFQNMINRIRYARKPVVSAIHGMVLGGACEITLASANVVAALESYIGLVELGAGLIPAGCGTTNLTARTSEMAASDCPSHIQPFLIKAFETIAMAKVSISAPEAMELGLLKPDAVIVMNAERRIYVAKEEVLRLSRKGYMPPGVRNSIIVLGAPGRAVLESAVHQLQKAGYATEYDQFLSSKLAYIMTGGDLSGPAPVQEDYLYELEINVFLSLLREKKTHERVESILKTNKPLRN